MASDFLEGVSLFQQGMRDLGTGFQAYGKQSREDKEKQRQLDAAAKASEVVKGSPLGLTTGGQALQAGLEAGAVDVNDAYKVMMMQDPTNLVGQLATNIKTIKDPNMMKVAESAMNEYLFFNKGMAWAKAYGNAQGEWEGSPFQKIQAQAMLMKAAGGSGGGGSSKGDEATTDSPTVYGNSIREALSSAGPQNGFEYVKGETIDQDKYKFTLPKNLTGLSEDMVVEADGSTPIVSALSRVKSQILNAGIPESRVNAVIDNVASKISPAIYNMLGSNPIYGSSLNHDLRDNVAKFITRNIMMAGPSNTAAVKVLDEYGEEKYKESAIVVPMEKIRKSAGVFANDFAVEKAKSDNEKLGFIYTTVPKDVYDKWKTNMIESPGLIDSYYEQAQKIAMYKNEPKAEVTVSKLKLDEIGAVNRDEVIDRIKQVGSELKNEKGWFRKQKLQKELDTLKNKLLSTY